MKRKPHNFLVYNKSFPFLKWSIPQQLSSFDDDVKCLLRKKIFLFEYSILHTDDDPYLDAELMKTSSFLFLL